MAGRTMINGRIQPEAFWMNMETMQAIQVAAKGELQMDQVVSPNRELLAYRSLIKDLVEGETVIVKKELIVTSLDGQQRKVIPWEKGWLHIVDWLDNERLVINLPEEDSVDKAASLLVLNPFSGARQVLHPQYPGIYNIPYIYGWDGARMLTLISPTFRQVAYDQIAEDGSDRLALWDLEKQQVVTSLSPYRGDAPVWSPDGSRLVVQAPLTAPILLGGPEELFLITQDGQIEQLTNLASYGRVSGGYSWSPDGRYIAAWLTTDALQKKEEAELIVIDTDSNQVINYCVRAKAKEEGEGPPPKMPVWSPSGEQLLVYDEDPTQPEILSRVILVDLVQGFAVQIAEAMEPMGWMLAP